VAVDLSRGDIPGKAASQLRQRPALAAEGGQDVQGGEHAGVSAPEVAEVVVTGVLAAENRVVLCHQRLHVGVTDPGADGPPAVLADDLDGGGAGDDIVHDGRARVAGQLAGRDQADDRGRRDRLAALVDEEAPVSIAIEGQSYVRAGLLDLSLAVQKVLRFERVGLILRTG
jgi:hypothetical protein